MLIETSDKADAKMRVFNRDGSEAMMAGNCLRSLAKYLYDNKIVEKTDMKIETASGIKDLKLYTRDGRVNSVSVNMGLPEFDPAKLPCTLKEDRIIYYPYEVGGRDYMITCLSIGNPHCVVFSDRIDSLDLADIGPLFENAPIFPERINTEFIRVVNRNTIKMRAYERGNGETSACGSGACAAVVAAVENGYLSKNTDITVKVRGGDLIVNYSDDGITLTGDTVLVYKGEAEV